MNESWISELNEHQRAAVVAPLGHTLVLAGAGSGKTRVLVSRIAWLMHQEAISPHCILAVTFTNKAANEMKSRLAHLLKMPVSGLWVGTFHGICHRLLRTHHLEANLPEHFHIMDSDDQERLIKRIMASLNINTEQWPTKAVQSFINSQKDEGLRAQHVHVSPYGPGRVWLQIYQAYEKTCQTAGVIDFAELMLRTVELFRNHPQLLQTYHERFRAILIDEFQDTNTIQYALIRLLTRNDTSVMVVGDDDQSIYGWRGAKIENIQRFSKDFPTTKVIRLEQNYRSTSVILDAANALITHNPTRMGKSLWTDSGRGELIDVFRAFNEFDETRFVSERIQQTVQTTPQQYHDIAVLYRSNAQSRVLEEAFLRAGIPYRIYGGLRFYDRAEIKDTLAYLRLLANPEDNAAFERVVNFPTRGIGEKTLEEIRALARQNEQSMWRSSSELIHTNALPQRASTALSQFLRLIHELRLETRSLCLEEQLTLTLERSGLKTHFSQLKGEQAESKMQNLQELVNAAREFRDEDLEHGEMPSLVAFLAHTSLEAGDLQAAEHDSYVHMMTLHAAKGLEFPFVFMVGMEEGLFPGRQSIEDPNRLEEERRLCYVGMTRAMQKLTLSYAEIRRQYGREERHYASRFLSELPASLLHEIRMKGQFQMSSKPTTTSPIIENCGFRLGQSVLHQKFGSGVVLAIEGSGEHTRIQVNFTQHGTKWLVLAYANLEAC